MISRRKFLAITQAFGVSALLPPLFSSCEKERAIKGGMVGSNGALGHRLRTMDFGAVTETIKKDVVIVGGGVSGLSAARYLKKNNVDFVLLELEESAGGNSLGGKNSITAYPWGAHYLPLPSNSDAELIQFLRESNAITGIKNGLPTFNEYYLCHDPKERLFIHNFWQEGIVPHEGVPKKDREEIQRFLELMNSFKNKIGTDNKPAFAIPLDESSQDAEFIALDKLTAEEFLKEKGYSSPYLMWYVNYCCADDFGTSIRQTSAWAMVHYFASRRGKASNANSDAVLTWPEGNYWLVQQLKKSFEDHIFKNSLCYQVKLQDGKVECLYFDASANRSKKIEAQKIILTTPQFINHHIVSVERSVDFSTFEYSPWMVANLTTTHSLTERRGETLCWDNVIYGSDSLGYVNAMHQHVGIPENKKVITYYKPLTSDNVVAVRKEAREKKFSQWQRDIMNDLKKAHPDLENHTEEMNVWLWGHGMIKPSKNFIWSDNRKLAGRTISNKIFFAHSDLSGISIFEEAFSHGHKAARAVLET